MSRTIMFVCSFRMRIQRLVRGVEFQCEFLPSRFSSSVYAALFDDAGSRRIEGCDDFSSVGVEERMCKRVVENRDSRV